MTALNMAGGPTALRRPGTFRMTLGVRVAITFALLFLVTGASLLAVNYALFAHSLDGHWAPVPTYPGSYIAERDRALISSPLTPPLERAAARGQLALVLAHPAGHFGGSLLPLVAGSQSAQPAIDRALNQMLGQSALILIPLALLAVALGWLAAQRMLRPVRQLTATARQLSAANLSQRLELSGPDDELKELGDTFDQMLARLDGAFESQRRFVANASHELRTPLTIMHTELDVTLDGKPADAESLRAMGQVIRAAVTRSERLVDGLLALAESERGIDRTERTDLAELVSPVLGHLAGDARKAGVRMAVTLQAAPVTGSRVLLERLVENLADNGIRHNHPGGWLAILTASHGDTATLIVESSGPPITAEQAASLFEPFRRLHADRVGSARGSGLGLSIVRAVARAHAGEATASPVADGGLRVTVTLPAARPAAVAARQEVTASRPTGDPAPLSFAADSAEPPLAGGVQLAVQIISAPLRDRGQARLDQVESAEHPQDSGAAAVGDGRVRPGEDLLLLRDQLRRMTLAGQVGEDQVTAGRHPLAEGTHDASRIGLVRDAVQDGDEQHRHRLREVDQPGHFRVGQDAPGIADVRLDHGDGIGVHQQRPGVAHHHRVVIHVDHVRVRVGLPDDFVYVALAGQAGTHIEKLADALRHREPDRTAEKPPVGPGHVPVLRGKAEQLFHRLPVGGEIVLAAEGIVVHAGHVRDAGIDTGRYRFLFGHCFSCHLQDGRDVPDNDRMLPVDGYART